MADQERRMITLDRDGKVITIEHPFDININTYLYENKYYAIWNKDKRRREIKLNRFDPITLKEKLDQFASDFDIYQVDATKAYRDWYYEADNHAVFSDSLDAVKMDWDQHPEWAEGLNPAPYGFQIAGVEFMRQCGGRCINADPMGAGKTLQAIHFARLNGGAVLVICPASLKLNWAREIRMHAQARVEVLNSEMLPTDIKKPKKNDVVYYIINYAIIYKYAERLLKFPFTTLLCDEAHYMKTRGTKRTKSALRFKKIKNIALLTGTPILNRPKELWTLLKMVQPDAWPAFHQYGLRYCNARHDGFGWDYNGSSNETELYSRLSKIMVRRKKADILPFLPKKTYSDVLIDIGSGRKKYDLAFNDYLQFLIRERRMGDYHRAKNNEHLVKINELKQMCIEYKMATAREIIDQCIADGSKVVLFSCYRAPLLQLNKEYADSVMVMGGMTPAQKQTSVDLFQDSDKHNLFLGSAKAAGVGYNLTAADKMIILDLPWTIGEISQMHDRIHRIGQTKPAHYYTLIGENTIDEYIIRMLNDKREVVESILDGKNPVDQNESIISALVEYLRGERT